MKQAGNADSVGHALMPATASAGRMTQDQLDLVVDALLGGPPAVVAAIADNAIITEMPDVVPVGEHKVLSGVATLLQVVRTPDSTAIIDAWDEMNDVGASSARVTLVDHDEIATVHFVDARHRFGIFLAFVQGAVSDIGPSPTAADPLRPRVALIRKDTTASIIDMDDSLPAMLGYSRDELLTKRSLDLLDPQDHEVALNTWVSLLSEPGGHRRVRLRHLRADGSWMWIEITNHNRLNDPEYGCVLTEMVDVSEEMAAHEALRQRVGLLRRLADSLPLGVAQTDREGSVTYSNQRFGKLVGWGAEPTLARLIDRVLESDRPRLGSLVDQALGGAADREVELTLTTEDGELRHCVVRALALTDDRGAVSGCLICVTDVTESTVLREELRRAATLDDLTQCLNRRSVLAELTDALSSGETDTAVVFVDLDDFKLINDRYGHQCGDALLLTCAQRLRHGLRTSDLIGRIGGDEFLVVCREVRSAEEAEAVAQRVAAAIQGTAVVGEHTMELHASIGVAWTLRPTDADSLVAAADAAMYESKLVREGQPVVHSLESVTTV
jgi:diguanylate cyclase (GGDEF)-like protein/PAS domain S-box-containing protein